MLEKPKAYTVTAITRMIKQSLEESFVNIWVEGEISNYHYHSSGHRYITLKDAGAVIKAVMWRSVGANLKFDPENGQKVLAFGSITVYEKGGNYQLNCRKMVPVGVGELELAFRQLYEKLSAEGLFAEEAQVGRFQEELTDERVGDVYSLDNDWRRAIGHAILTAINREILAFLQLEGELGVTLDTTGTGNFVDPMEIGTGALPAR